MRPGVKGAPGLPAALAGAIVVPMGESDLDQVLRIESASFGSPWRREHFVYEIRYRGSHASAGPGPRRVADVLRDGGHVVGYVCAWILFDELKINNIAVAPVFRGRGVGRWLLRQLLAVGRDAGCTRAALEVRPSNRPALALYRTEGFVEAGRRPNYYEREAEDALLLELDLTRCGSGR